MSTQIWGEHKKTCTFTNCVYTHMSAFRRNLNWGIMKFSASSRKSFIESGRHAGYNRESI